MNSTARVVITEISGILGSTSNVYTLVCIARFRHLRSKVTNILIGNMCVCGVLLAITGTVVLMNYTVNVTLMDSVVGAASITTLYMSLLIILLIGVDRMIAVADPIGYKIRMTQKKAGLALVIMWVICTGFCMGVVTPTLYETNMCRFFPETVYKSFVLPLTVIITTAVVAIYVGILVEFLRQRKRAKLQFSGQFLPAIRRSRYLTKMTLFILIVFLATWLPYMTVTLRGPPAEGSSEVAFRTYRWIDHITHGLLHASSFTNCLVYAFTNPEYRKAYRDLLGCKKSQVNPSSSF
ncbi:hypothetical protein CAPTEDRAFT_203009 [Capitella teleta]|uniref:G-protein coupled receptors family 1 profile domain-containing protein n=1 Tax=Capitella teleta TaxID=283909 RepID=R7TNA0_CAPTE|nr:hypothetical protein CAPTEDRAFT_203009 [Capitella teleta]|eukprot:ELT95119.1 hypothetical protein CAPTEDRAFT_203009 [Capitella teleta]